MEGVRDQVTQGKSPRKSRSFSRPSRPRRPGTYPTSRADCLVRIQEEGTTSEWTEERTEGRARLGAGLFKSNGTSSAAASRE